MINIEPTKMGLDTAYKINWYIPEYNPQSTSQEVVIIFYGEEVPINNWNNTPLGVKLVIPPEVVEKWGTDDSVITNYLLEKLSLKRVV